MVLFVEMARPAGRERRNTVRLIDADALLKHETEADRMGAMLVVGKGYILDAPEVDAVPVVRCKECKHDGTWQCHMEYDEYHPEADIHHEMHGDDDFCSYGVKEDGDSNDE